jgi:hypothetical protein
LFTIFSARFSTNTARLVLFVAPGRPRVKNSWNIHRVSEENRGGWGSSSEESDENFKIIEMKVTESLSNAQ